MILLTILVLAMLVGLIIIVPIIGVGGIVLVIMFADVIAFITLIVWIIKGIAKRKKIEA